MSATGTGLLDFGAFPGASDAQLVITGQAGIVSGSYVEAWIFPAATTDHTADEHWVEPLKVMAGNIVAGTGFTIYGINTNTLTEPVVNAPNANNIVSSTAGTAIAMKNAQPGNIAYGGGKGTLLYGKFNVAWVWN
jgi:hypothetical protein